MRIVDLWDEFELYARAANRSPHTIRWYQRYVTYFGRFLSERGYPDECEEITTRIIREYVGTLQTTLAPKTVANSVSSLKGIFAWGVREGLLSSDPTTRVPVPKVPRTDYEVFGPAEVDALLRACDTKRLTGSRDFAIVMLLFDTGIRASEIIGLTDSSVDYERGLVTVFGKGAKARAVPVSNRTLRAIKRYVNHRKRLGFDPASRLFLSNIGEALTYSGLAQLLRRLGKRAGLHTHPHKFRHSFAVTSLRNEAPLASIQDTLGHTTLHMTRHYARQSATALSEHHKRYSPADRLKVRV